jgi:hypothetical protein
MCNANIYLGLGSQQFVALGVVSGAYSELASSFPWQVLHPYDLRFEACKRKLLILC